MRNRLALLAAALVVSPAAAQQATYSSAAPPDRAALDRLNLRSEWTAYVPLEGRHDSVASVQVIDEAQVIVQTRSGLLLALDATTGAKRWTFRYPAGYVAMYPVAVNEHFVFAVNVARLYCFHRYSGILEFDYELAGSPSAGPLADARLVYVVLNGAKVVAFEFPSPYRIAPVNPTGKPGAAPSDVLASRYAIGTGRSVLKEATVEAPQTPPELEPTTGLAAVQRSPSVSALPSITPPYTLSNRGLYASPSLSPLTSLRQPYQLKPDFMQFNQRTPSVSVLPPSLSRVYELSNFRPKGVEPRQAWVYGSTRRLGGQPIRATATVGDAAGGLFVNRLWLTADSPTVTALSASNGVLQVGGPIQDVAVGPMAGPLAFTRPDVRPTDPEARTLVGYLPLADGNVLAIDLLGGTPDGPRVEWRANVGGLLNRKPVATPDGVFVAGDNTGVVKLDTATGDVAWRTEPTTDRVLAVNQEFVYARDRQGNLLVYDRRAPSDAATRRANPLAKLATPGFEVPITNHQTDRVFLAADSGILVCLRDASAKYARPVAVTPPLPAPPPAAKKPADPMEPKAEEPKKEEPKKVEPKKDEPKKDGKE